MNCENLTWLSNLNSGNQRFKEMTGDSNLWKACFLLKYSHSSYL